MFEFEIALGRKDAEEARLNMLQMQQQEGMVKMGHMGSADQEAYTQSRFRVLKRAGKQTLVCRHWLKNICPNGSSCDFVHHFEVSKLPVCQAFATTGHCRDYLLNCCPFLHTRSTDQKKTHLECAMFFLGFCPFGSRCRLMHFRRQSSWRPDILPDWYLEFVLGRHVAPLDENNPLVASKIARLNLHLSQLMSVSRSALANEGLVLQSAWGLPELCRHVDTPGLQKLYRDVAYSDDPASVEFDVSFRVPLRAFVIKSMQMRNVFLSVQLGIWASGRNNTAKLEHAYLNSDVVLLLFSGNESGGFQGYARMASPPDASLCSAVWGPFSNRLGSTFRVQWIKQCHVEFEQFQGPAKTAPRNGMCLINPLNDGRPIKKSRDGQEYTAGLAVLLCRLMEDAASIDILQGTDLEALPRLNHQEFFHLAPHTQLEEDARLGLRAPPTLQPLMNQPLMNQPPPPPLSSM
ncbi:MAG: hypothetical protein KVP17_001978 [Porospora cf. gigantea B]|uniref:uncharacterized protein n=1 Tax=Porospora cf. gigantea B TaxID=2853592 RepID=UPI003571CA5E|nr:MAG: hypothetical protein KVP17_001978 [Porospora cf. gigantea B]